MLPLCMNSELFEDMTRGAIIPEGSKHPFFIQNAIADRARAKVTALLETKYSTDLLSPGLNAIHASEVYADYKEALAVLDVQMASNSKTFVWSDEPTFSDLYIYAAYYVIANSCKKTPLAGILAGFQHLKLHFSAMQKLLTAI